MTEQQLATLRPGDRVHVSYASSSCHGGKITDVVTVDRVDGRYVLSGRYRYDAATVDRRVGSVAEDACAAVAEAIRHTGETYAEPDWNPDAHVSLTITVADARLVLDAAPTPAPEPPGHGYTPPGVLPCTRAAGHDGPCAHPEAPDA